MRCRAKKITIKEEVNKHQKVTKHIRKLKAKNKGQTKMSYADMYRVFRNITVKYVRSLEQSEYGLGWSLSKSMTTVAFQQKHINELKQGTELLVEKYEERIKELEAEKTEVYKKLHHTIRSYNLLAKMGRYVGEDEIRNYKLPEQEREKWSEALEGNPDNFKISNTLMESGEVKTTISAKPNATTKGKNEKDKKTNEEANQVPKSNGKGTKN
tara:strand:- start:98 stop:733 length:636 start_codon:yes stop_codon:yes gene_type:complete